MAQTIQSLIAASVHGVLQEVYPDTHSALCHAHAIVGANVVSIVLNRVYRPVAGLAVIDCGAGQFVRLTDNMAFANPAGGAFHCWIESVDELIAEKEVIDFALRHAPEYARRNGLLWRYPELPDFVWGPASRVVAAGAPPADGAALGPDVLWLRETDEGWNWITRHAAENINAYVALTAQTLQQLQRSLPQASSLLASVMTERDPAPAIPSIVVTTGSATTGSAPASVPTLSC
jgi:hypothetical protein